MAKIPRDKNNDYSLQMAQSRREFIQQQTNTQLHNLGHFSVEPQSLPGNIENFTGVAQVPIGFAGPMTVHGESAKGEFYTRST